MKITSIRDIVTEFGAIEKILPLKEYRHLPELGANIIRLPYLDNKIYSLSRSKNLLLFNSGSLVLYTKALLYKGLKLTKV